MQKKNIYVIYVIAIVVMLGISGWLVLEELHKKDIKLDVAISASEKLETPDISEEADNISITVDTEMIQDGLRKMNFLVTEEYYFTQVETYAKEKKLIFGLTSEAGFIYSYDGLVTAGIQCDDIVVTKDESRKCIQVKIPKSYIYNVEVDYQSFKRYEEKESIWNKLDMSDYNSAMIQFEDAARNTALEKGVLNKADENAISAISNLAQSLVDISKCDWDIEVVQ